MPARAASQRAGPSSRRHTQVEEDDDEGIVVSSDDELENIQPSAGPSTGRAGPSKGTQRQTQHKTPATTGGKRGRNSGAQTVPKSKNGKRARNESPPQHEQQAPEEDIPADERPFEYPQEEIAELRRKVESAKAEYDSQVETTHAQISDRDLNSMVGAAVRHMLFSHYTKPGALVEQSKLTAAFTAEHQELNKRKIVPVVLAATQHKLLQIAALEMVEVTKKGAAQMKKGATPSQADGGGTKCYRLMSALPTNIRQVITPPEPTAGFILLVLTLIKQKGGKMTEDELCETLSEVGVHHGQGNTEKHPKLGKIGDLLTSMTQHRYLIKNKEIQGGVEGGAVDTYQWGEVAYAEIGEDRVEEWIDKVFQDDEHHVEAVVRDADEPIVLSSDEESEGEDE